MVKIKLEDLTINEYQLYGEQGVFSTDVRLTRRPQPDGSVLWSVDRNGSVLDMEENLFIYSPMPSSRTEEYYRCTRFATPEEAIAAFERYLAKHNKERAS